jgi:NAD-dependent SIR2 family protein deacetylase
MKNGEVDFFLGAGASISSGIPMTNEMIWEFKKSIYCSENEKPQELFKDLQSSYSRNIIQEYLDIQGVHPKLGDANEYSHYFELCYNTNIARNRYIQQKVSNIQPSLGYKCLGKLITTGKVIDVWTVNFDELIEAGIKSIYSGFSVNVLSSANQANKSTDLASVYKLHGDYRYDQLKNISNELKTLENELHNAFLLGLQHKALVVIGFSGRDDSIMNLLESNINNRDFLKYGLIWMLRENTKLPERVSKLMEQACAVNSASCIVEISGFDDIMYKCCKQVGLLDEKIEDIYQTTEKKTTIEFSQRDSAFIKYNTFVSHLCPAPYCFQTDITSWKQLREITDGSSTIAALYSSHIYCFEDIATIKQVFGTHIKSEIKTVAISKETLLFKFRNIYTNMLFSIIGKSLYKQGLRSCNEIFEYRKFYNPLKTEYIDNHKTYSAIEIYLSWIDDKYYMSIIPTIYVDEFIDNEMRTAIVNKKMSTLYNAKYDDELKVWRKDFFLKLFEYKDFKLQFNNVWITSGLRSKNDEWPELAAYKQNEPVMVFDIDNKNTSISQLQGISKYGPLDYSYTKEKATRNPIKLALITPNEDKAKILHHLYCLHQQHIPHEKSKDKFVIKYSSFESIFKKGLSIPTDKNIITYDGTKAVSNSISDFLNTMKQFINKIDTGIDIVVIYIPERFKVLRESGDYNLHDALKLYATDKGIKLQFIEERSINYYDKCKVMWALSTSLYAKASGTLWHPKILDQSTAFVGVSYAQSEDGICIGCSQLFDST